MEDIVFAWLKFRLNRISQQQASTPETLGTFLLCLVLAPFLFVYWLFWEVAIVYQKLRGKYYDYKLRRLRGW